MKENILNEFDEKENNNILNQTDNTENSIIENNLIKKDSNEDNALLEKFKQGSVSSEIDYNYTISSTFYEKEKDKSYYPIIHNCKDFLIMLSLLMCSSFNFNYLYLPLLLIGFYYIKFLLKNEMEERRKKSNFEAIIFIYCLLLLIYKIIIIILITKKNEYIEKKHDIFIDFGIAYLLTEGVFDFIKSIIGESVIIICCICSFIIRKIFAFNNEDLNKIKFNNLKNINKKLVLYIFLSFFIIAGFATFNKSILTFCYIIPFYIVLITFSLSSQNKAYFIFQAILYCILFSLFFHLLIINISNIYSIAYKFFDPKKTNKNFLAKNWSKFGFYFAYYDDDIIALFEDWTGYVLGCLSFVILSFISKDLFSNNYSSKKSNNNEEENEIKQNNCLTKILNKFLKFFSGPYFILHIVRILAIIWIYCYRNFFSLGIFLWIFFSFIYLDVNPIKTLSVFILLPATFVSLGCMHISRILNSYFSNLDDDLKVKYLHFSLGNYSYDYIKFCLSNIFFCLIICFIYSLNENNDLNINLNKNEKKDKNINIENELDEPLLKDINDESRNINLKEGNELIEPLVKDTNEEIINIDLITESKEEIIKKEKENENENEIKNIELNDIIKNTNKENDIITLSGIIKKNIFINIDKITLVVMYFVANKEVNLFHLIFVIVFMIQLLTPQFIKKLCIFIIILFQLLFFIEYIMDLIKVYDYNNLKKRIDSIKFFLKYNFVEDDKNKSLSDTSIEIYIFCIIYCFYIHYQLYNNELYQNLTLNKEINLPNYIEKKLTNFPIIKKILYFIGNIIIEIYIWVLICCFIFFSCYFEINFIFAIKLFIFFLSVYQFCIFIQKNKLGEGNIDLKLSRILLIYSGLNTLVVYTYQVMCLKYTGLKEKIQNSHNFIVENFPNIGLTQYQDENLYYNLLPHFFINFLSLLYLWEMKRILTKFENLKKNNETIALSNDIDAYKNKQKKEEDLFNIDTSNKEKEKEENEEEDDEDEDPRTKAYEKYHSNKTKMTILNIKYLFSLIITSFTKLYWLFLFITTCIIYTSQDLSAGIFIYIFIFGITFITMFYSIMKPLNNFIKEESYFMSKVIRYYLIEKKLHIQKNKSYRSISFRFLLGFSLLLVFMFYLYGVFDLFQHGCDEDIFFGCEKSYCPIVSFDIKNSTDHNNTEATIESISYLLGYYIDTSKKGIMSAAWVHLLFAFLIAFDVYIQKIENYFVSWSSNNRKTYRILLNENLKLKALFTSGEDNFLFNIGKFANNNRNTESSVENISLSSSYNLSISKMDNLSDYDDLFNLINSNLKQKRITLKEEDEILGKKYIIQFLEAFRKASTKNVSLSSKKNKYKVIRAIKGICEEIIIFLLLCNAITKLNIWSFIYLAISIYFILTKKTMMKYYILFCFIIFAIFIQVIIFISNIKEEIDPTPDKEILEVIKQKLNIPWYQKSEKVGFFLGLGIVKSQVNLLWMEFAEIIIIYIYLDYFSYSIYQEVQNKGSNKNNTRINYYNLHLDKRVNLCVKTMSSKRFKKIQECMKYNLDIDLGEFDDFRNKILLSEANVTELPSIKEENESEKSDKKNKDRNTTANIKNITNDDANEKKKKLLNVIFPTRKTEFIKAPTIENKDKDSNMAYSKKEKIKIKMQTFLEHLYELSYLSFHNIILIIIVIISMMISGLFSLFYITFSLYFLVTSNKMYLGEKYYYPKAIKKILRVAIIVDITIQIIYQTPYFSINKNEDEDNILITILEVIGFQKIINYSKKNEEKNNFDISTHEMVLVIAKAICYFFMSLQILIYSSKDFQEHYLTYIITRKEYLRRKSLMNVFRFNNKRIKAMNKSIKLREEMSLSMNSLQRILDNWNDKLSDIDPIKNSSSIILIDSISNDKLNNNNNIDINDLIPGEEIKEEKIINKEEVRKNIRNWILDRKLIKLEKWIFKYCIDYSKINTEEKDEYEWNLIQGNTDVQTVIEKMVDLNLDKLELDNFTESELKEVKKFFDGNREEQIKKVEEQKKMKRKKQHMQLKTRFVTKILEDLNEKEKILDGKNLNEDQKEEKDKDDKDRDNKKKEKGKKDKKEEEEEEKEEKEEDLIDLTQQKFRVIENFAKAELFKKYLKTTYIIKCLISDFFTYCSKKFHFVCYLMMIIDHIQMASFISMIYPLSIFCYAILEYPRPGKNYWVFCIGYSIIVLSIKCMLQLELLVIIFEDKEKIGSDGKPSNLYLDFLEILEHYKFGLKYTKTTFSYEFFRYIIFDALVIIFLLINNYLLINNGLWDQKEQDIENIYYANDRVAKTKDIKTNNIDEIKKLSILYLLSKREQEYLSKKKTQFERKTEKNEKKLGFFNRITKAKKEEEKENKKSNIKRILDSINILKKEEFKNQNYITIDTYSESNKSYFERLFPKIRNEKPGGDLYWLYTISMVLVIIFIILFYTTMIQDVTFNALSKETNQFSGSMIIFLIFHIIFLFYDRIIYINQNKNNIRYDYIIYDKVEKKALSETRYNQIKTDISMKYYNQKRDNFIIPADYAEKMRKNYNIVYIQNEEFNKPLLQKYILHIFIVLFIHAFIFFYSPMKGNYNMNRSVYCIKDEDEDENDNSYLEFCNDFNNNWALIVFYLIYLTYFIFSGVQIKFGFYDMKRKSMLKSGSSSISGIINNTFRNIPFLYEIKLAIDWTFTSTCLGLFQWNKFESVYDTVYTTYCAMNAKNQQLVGQQVGKTLKIGLGGTLSFGLIIILIFPIYLFSSLNPTNQLNNLKAATLSAELSFLYDNGLMTNYTLYKNTKPESIKDFSKHSKDWEKYGYSKSSNTKNFPKDQIQIVQFSPTSDRNWGLAKPHINKLIEILGFETVNDTELNEIRLIVDYQFQRDLPVEARIAGDRRGFVIYNKEKDGIINENSEIGKFKKAISYCYNDKIVFKNIYSAPIRLTANVNSEEIEDKKYIKKYDVYLGFTGCKNISNYTNNPEEIYDKNGNIYHSYLESYFTFGNENDTNKDGLIFHIFSDKVSSTTSGYSIMTFYLTFILICGTYVRDFFAGQPTKITLTEMPYCQEIINLCEGIKVSRYSYDFEQEEKLYYILIELMRSPDYLKYLTDSSVDQFNKRKKLNEKNKEK